jgi:hypothetical protein
LKNSSFKSTQAYLLPVLLLLVLATWLSTANIAKADTDTTNVAYKTIEIEGLDIFYREAGNP